MKMVVFKEDNDDSNEDVDDTGEEGDGDDAECHYDTDT